MQDKALAMLGMATKAGKVVSGEFSVEKAVKEGKAWLVLVAEDASDNTKKSFTNMCEFYECDLVFIKIGTTNHTQYRRIHRPSDKHTHSHNLQQIAWPEGRSARRGNGLRN